MQDDQPPPLVSWTFEAIGTQWFIAIYQPLSQSAQARIRTAVQQRIAAFDKIYSRFRTDSEVAKWATGAGSYPLPADAAPLFELYRQLYDATDGVLTPLIGQTLSDAGYDHDYSLRPQPQLSRPLAWDEVLDYDKLSMRLTLFRPALLDFGAAGKGYLVDIVAGLLRRQGIVDVTIDAGGDIYASHPDWTENIGLENPAIVAAGDNDVVESVIGVIGLRQGAVCGSAGNRRRWGDYHHIIDPRSLSPSNKLRAAWVYATSAMLADGLATALYFIDPARLQTTFQFAYALVHTDGRYQVSDNFPGKFF